MKIKKFILGIGIGLLAGIVIGCGGTVIANTFNFTETDSTSMYWRIGFANCISNYVDDETGVNYLILYDEDSMVGICPRYNTDGTLMIQEEEDGSN